MLLLFPPLPFPTYRPACWTFIARSMADLDDNLDEAERVFESQPTSQGSILLVCSLGMLILCLFFVLLWTSCLCNSLEADASFLLPQVRTCGALPLRRGDIRKGNCRTCDGADGGLTCSHPNLPCILVPCCSGKMSIACAACAKRFGVRSSKPDPFVLESWLP